jgi:ribosomal protein S18 acetylase RimI-like enzyme
MIDLALIRSLEERGFNAWPARQTILLGGWVLRLSGGYTKRANSVNPLNPTLPFREVKAAAESIYALHRLPTIFRLSPLAAPEIDRALDDAGYVTFDPSLVLVAPLSDSPGDGDVGIGETPSQAWLEGFAAANGIGGAHRPIHDRMVGAIAMPKAFATVFENGDAVGFGLGVYERGAVGVFDLVVAPSARGRGHGRALTRALLQWGRKAGARHAYLQVREQNALARKLYAGLGFDEAYRYHYRVPHSVDPC